MITLAPTVYAQDDFEDDIDYDDEVSVADAAVATYVNKIDEKCECNPASIAAYEKCSDKWLKKAEKAFQAAAKFAGEPRAEIRSALNDERDALIAECEDPGDDEFDDEPDDEFDDFPGGDI